MTNQARSNEFGIWAMAIGNFAAGMSSLIMAGVLSEIAADLNVSTGQAGQLITIFSLVYALGAPIIIALMGRFDRKIMLTIGLVFIFGGSLLATFASTYSVLFVARIIAALGSATFVPLSAAVAISLASEEDRGRVSAIVFSGFTLSTALGLPIGTYFGLNYGWRFSFVAVVLLALIGAILVWTQLPRGVQTPPVNLVVFRKVFRNGLLMAILLVTVLQFGGQMALFSFIGPWLLALTELGANGITLVLLAIGMGGVVGNYVAGIGTDRFGARMVQLILIIALIIVMAFLPVIQASLILGGILLFFWGFVGQGFVSPQLIRLVDVAPELSSASLSLNSAFINVGLSLGAFAGGIYLDQVGIESISWLGVGGATFALLIFGLSWVMENRHTEQN